MSAQQPAKDSTRLVIPVAAVIALAIMGDSLMYSLLPLQAERLGFSLAGVGLLLSANRIIRLLSNTWAGLAFERFGSKAPFIFAAVLSVLTTWLYGAGMGFAVFFLARAGWGVAWSILRQGGFVAVWAAGSNRKGRLMGSLWGMVRVGSAVSVLLGGYLYDRFGFSTAVSAITVVTLFAIPGAMLIRWPHNHFAGTSQARSPLAGLREGLANSPRRWLLVVGFLYTFMEALIAVTLSKYIQLNYGDTITSLGVGIGI
ncbi:MAG: MFS transporter, partial [Chloroflexota bacterium]